MESSCLTPTRNTPSTRCNMQLHVGLFVDCLSPQLVGAAFGAAGQRCMALSTAIFVGEAKEWLPEVVEKGEQGVWPCIVICYFHDYSQTAESECGNRGGSRSGTSHLSRRQRESV